MYVCDKVSEYVCLGGREGGRVKIHVCDKVSE